MGFSDDAKADLSFMRAVVEESSLGHFSKGIGLSLTVAGVAFGAQALTLWAQINALIVQSEAVSLLVTGGAVGALLITLSFVFYQKRTRLIEASMASRALSSVFVGFGATVMTLALVFAVVGVRSGGAEIWQLFGAVFSAVQVFVWAALALFTRRFWFAVIAAGWFVSSVGLALLYGHNHYLLAMAFVLLVLMALPGLMLRRGPQA